MEKFTDKLKREEESKQATPIKPEPKAGYIARVVLHRVDGSEDYEDFHEVMEGKGFLRTINGISDAKIKVVNSLPGGMYYFDSNIHSDKAFPNLIAAYDSVKDAVAQVMKKAERYVQDSNTPPSVFVIETTYSRWTGLKPAPKPDTNAAKE